LGGKKKVTKSVEKQSPNMRVTTRGSFFRKKEFNAIIKIKKN
jgi:hypothetical protein